MHLLLDAGHTGVGGDTGWRRTIHPEYFIGDGIYTYKFCFVCKQEKHVQTVSKKESKNKENLNFREKIR